MCGRWSRNSFVAFGLFFTALLLADHSLATDLLEEDNLALDPVDFDQVVGNISVTIIRCATTGSIELTGNGSEFSGTIKIMDSEMEALELNNFACNGCTIEIMYNTIGKEDTQFGLTFLSDGATSVKGSALIVIFGNAISLDKDDNALATSPVAIRIGPATLVDSANITITNNTGIITNNHAGGSAATHFLRIVSTITLLGSSSLQIAENIASVTKESAFRFEDVVMDSSSVVFVVARNRVYDGGPLHPGTRFEVAEVADKFFMFAGTVTINGGANQPELRCNQINGKFVREVSASNVEVAAALGLCESGTMTPSLIATPSATESAMATRSPTPTVVPTPTATASLSASHTSLSPSVSTSPSNTPSNTEMPPKTETETASPSPSTSSTVSPADTRTQTASHSDTISGTPSGGTPSDSIPPTRTQTRSLPPTPTRTSSAPPTRTETFSLSRSGETPTPSKPPTRTETRSRSDSLSASASLPPTPSLTLSLPPTRSTTFSSSRSRTQSESHSSSPSWSATHSATASIPPTRTKSIGTPTFSATSSVSLPPTPTSSGSRTNSRSFSRSVSVSSSISFGTFSSSSSASFSSSMSVSFSDLTPSGTASHEATASLELTASVSISLSFSESSSQSESVSASLSTSLSQTDSASLSVSTSESSSSSISISESASVSATDSTTGEPTASYTLSVSMTRSGGTETMTFSLPLTTSAIPPTTSPPPTPTQTLATSCPRCHNGTCSTQGPPWRCVCFQDFERGFWKGGEVEGGMCLECADNFWGPNCIETCPGGRCAPCSYNGICDDGVNGTGRCNCFRDEERGYWDGEQCDQCLEGYFNLTCRQRCTCQNGACVDGTSGNGTCRCYRGWEGENCDRCETNVVDPTRPNFWGPDCRECPGMTPNGAACSGQGVCSETFGNCTCDERWTGSVCNIYCPDCVPICEDPCLNDGICDPVLQRCRCTTSYVGPQCQYACPKTVDGAVCGNRGTCIARNNQGECACFNNETVGFWDPDTACAACTSAYAGSNCDVRCPHGAGNQLCSGHGTCNATTGRCMCSPAGYCGTACEESVAAGGCGSCAEGLYGASCEFECICSSHGTCSDGRSGDGSCACQWGYAGATCTIICEGGLANPCNGTDAGTCQLDGSCRCNPGYHGWSCSVACPGVPSNICSGPARGTCQTDGTCRCEPQYAGRMCQLPCDCANSIVGWCPPELDNSTCRCNPLYAGPGCNDCQRGFSGTSCNTPCVNGNTVGRSCVCEPYFGGPGCTVRCPFVDGTACNGRGDCVDGECRCQPEWFGPSCNCSLSVCTSEPFSMAAGNVHCNASTGRCECGEQWSGRHCADCSSNWWGALCDEVCGCVNGECDRLTGTCVCYSDPRRGFWRGSICTECQEGYLEGCVQVSSLSSQMASLQVIDQNLLTYISRHLVLFAELDILIASGQMIAQFDGASLPTGLHTTFSTLFALTRCRRVLATWRQTGEVTAPLLSFMTGDTLDDCSFISNRDNRITLWVIPLNETFLNDALGAIELHVPNHVRPISEPRGAFSFVRGEPQWRPRDPSFAAPTACTVVSVDIGLSSYFSLLCMPTSELLTLRNQTVIKAMRDVFLGVTIQPTLPGDPDMNELFAATYLSSVDRLIVIGRSSGMQCVAYSYPASLQSTQHSLYFVWPSCRHVDRILELDSWLYAAIRDADGAKRIVRVRTTDPNGAQREPSGTALTSGGGGGGGGRGGLEPDVVVDMVYDPISNTTIVVANNGVRLAKFVRISHTAFEEDGVIGSQALPSAADEVRLIAAAAVDPQSRILFLLQQRTTGVSVRRFAIYEVLRTVPEISDRRGGTVVTVVGRGFLAGDKPARCRVGATESTATIVNSTTLVCATGPSSGSLCEDDTLEVAIANDLFTTNKAAIVRVDAPRITRVEPALQQWSQVEPVTVHGDGFVESPTIICRYFGARFGPDAADATDVQIVPGVYRQLPSKTPGLAPEAVLVCEAPTVAGSWEAAIDVAVDGTVFTGTVNELDPRRVTFVGEAAGIYVNPAHITTVSGASVLLPAVSVGFMDDQGTPLGAMFPDQVDVLIRIVTPAEDAAVQSAPQLEGAQPVMTDRLTRIAVIDRLRFVLAAAGLAKIRLSIQPIFNDFEINWTTTLSVQVVPGTISKLAMRFTRVNEAFFATIPVTVQDDANNTVIHGSQGLTVSATVHESPLPDLYVPERVRRKYPIISHELRNGTVNDAGIAEIRSVFIAARGGFEYHISIFLDSLPHVQVGTPSIVPSCQPGMFKLPGSFTCQECLPHSRCANVGAQLVTVDPGFWRASPFSEIVFRCAPVESCAGGNGTGQCGPGYRGPICSVCDAGYGRDVVARACVNCVNTAFAVGLFVMLLVIACLALSLIVVIAAQNWSRMSRTMVVLELLVTHMHTATIVGALDFNFPFFFRTAMAWISAVFDVRILDVFMSDCVMRADGTNFYTKFTIYSLTPLIALLIASIAWLIMFVWPNIMRISDFDYERAQGNFQGIERQKQSDRNAEHRSTLDAHILQTSLETGSLVTMRQATFRRNDYRFLAITSLQVVLFFTFPTTIFYALSISNCTSINDGFGIERHFLTIDMSIDCNTPTYTTFRIVGFCVACAFLVGVPLIYLISHFYHIRFRERKRVERRQLFSFLMQGIKQQAWYWPAVVYVRKGLSTAIVIWLKQPLDSYLLMWLLGMYLPLLCYVSPYQHHRNTALEMLGVSGAILATNIALTLEVLHEPYQVVWISSATLFILLAVMVFYGFFASERVRLVLWQKFRTAVLNEVLTESESSEEEEEEGDGRGEAAAERKSAAQKLKAARRATGGGGAPAVAAAALLERSSESGGSTGSSRGNSRSVMGDNEGETDADRRTRELLDSLIGDGGGGGSGSGYRPPPLASHNRAAMERLKPAERLAILQDPSIPLPAQQRLPSFGASPRAAPVARERLKQPTGGRDSRGRWGAGGVAAAGEQTSGDFAAFELLSSPRGGQNEPRVFGSDEMCAGGGGGGGGGDADDGVELDTFDASASPAATTRSAASPTVAPPGMPMPRFNTARSFHRWAPTADEFYAHRVMPMATEEDDRAAADRPPLPPPRERGGMAGGGLSVPRRSAAGGGDGGGGRANSNLRTRRSGGGALSTDEMLHAL